MTNASASAKANITRFNAEASTWDDNPAHLETAELALQALIRYNILPQAPEKLDGESKDEALLNALEIGCGTGILTLLAQPYLRSIIGVDTSQGMLDVFHQKIEHQKKKSSGPNGTRNILGVCTLFSDPENPDVQNAVAQLAKDGIFAKDEPEIQDQKVPKFDLILSLLTMHHITDHAAILKIMRGSLRPGGKIALVDFEDFGPNAALFHPKHKHHGVEHHGLKREKMKDDIAAAGFENVKVETAFALPKKVEEGEKSENMDFPFLICIGQCP